MLYPRIYRVYRAWRPPLHSFLLLPASILPRDARVRQCRRADSKKGVETNTDSHWSVMYLCYNTFTCWSGNQDSCHQLSRCRYSSGAEDVRNRRYLCFWKNRQSCGDFGSGYYNFNVRMRATLGEKLTNMRENPNKERLVERASNWPWSSW